MTSGLFTSSRERRLWGWTLAVVIAIYGGAGFARTLADELAGTGIGEGLFIACCLLVLAMVVTQGLTRKPGRAEIGVAVGVAAVYVLVFARMAVPTERSHLIEYGVVALLIHEALLERSARGARVPRAWLLAIAATIVLGVIDECVQLFLPSRVFDTDDMLFNALAAVMAVGSAGLLRRVRTARAERERV